MGGEHRLGRTRSEFETNLRKERGVSNLSVEEIDKCRFVEKKTGATWVGGDFIDGI